MYTYIPLFISLSILLLPNDPPRIGLIVNKMSVIVNRVIYTAKKREIGDKENNGSAIISRSTSAKPWMDIMIQF